MATRTTLNVSLPLELGRFVESLVANGQFASASEVVRTALRLLRERESKGLRDEAAQRRADQ
jgi:putative addiction module CopG family antidote